MFNSLKNAIPGGADKAAAGGLGGLGNSMMDAGKAAALEEAQNQAKDALGDNELAGNMAANAIGAAAGEGG